MLCRGERMENAYLEGPKGDIFEISMGELMEIRNPSMLLWNR